MAKKRNERTSARVAKIAAKVLAIKTITPYRDLAIVSSDGQGIKVTWADLRALAASCLTQAPDKPKPKAQARGRK